MEDNDSPPPKYYDIIKEKPSLVTIPDSSKWRNNVVIHNHWDINVLSESLEHKIKLLMMMVISVRTSERLLAANTNYIWQKVTRATWINGFRDFACASRSQNRVYCLCSELPDQMTQSPDVNTNYKAVPTPTIQILRGSVWFRGSWRKSGRLATKNSKG